MLIVHKSVNNIAPIYISELLKVYTPSRNLRSNNMSLLKEPTSKRTWGDRSFSVAAPRLWNHLPPQLKSCHSITRFKSLLKTPSYVTIFQRWCICNCIVHVPRYIIIFFAITVNCLCLCFFLFPRLEHPAGWICARYKSLLLLLLFRYFRPWLWFDMNYVWRSNIYVINNFIKQLGVLNHINQRLPTRRYGGVRPRGNIKNEYRNNNSTRTRETRRGYSDWRRSFC